VERVYGFEPVFDENSRVLVLGSFPSVKSRQTDFYYGNRQNRFWKMLSDYTMTPMPASIEEKKRLLHGHGIALWDIATSCCIRGSADDSITDYTVADLNRVLKNAKIELILLNGKKAAEIFLKYYGDLAVAYQVMPSTSPANPRYHDTAWKEAFDGIFGVAGRTE
jgi:hypoxanthine-DNA glycosylase